jgi:ribosomal protein S18 acetylase RimI-like enzyme
MKDRIMKDRIARSSRTRPNEAASKPVRSVRLDPISAAEYPAWEKLAVDGYAESQVRAGHWTAETATELSAREFRELLPQGPATPGHHLWIARDAETVAKVGGLWVMVRPRGGHIEAFIYDVYVEPHLQGGGYGRAIMEAAAEAAKKLGADVVALNVHGYNDRAYNLYKSLGYVVANRYMRLEL